MDTSPRRFRRGETSLERPGFVFWGMSRGKELWLSPQKFEHNRQIKNALARKTAKTPKGRAKKQAHARIYSKTAKYRERQARYQREHRHIYSPRQKKTRAAYKQMRRATDPMFRIKFAIGGRIREGFKYQCKRKQAKSIDLLGCTYEFFRQRIVDQFEDGMTLENYGIDTWHIDHVIPVCLFDLSNEVAARHAFNYRNCRPAWSESNLSKNDRLDMALVAKHNLWEWLPYTNSQLEAAA